MCTLHVAHLSKYRCCTLTTSAVFPSLMCQPCSPHPTSISRELSTSPGGGSAIEHSLDSIFGLLCAFVKLSSGQAGLGEISYLFSSTL